MEKVFELDKKKVTKEAFPAAIGFIIIALYGLTIFLLDLKYDFFFMLLVLNSQSHSYKRLFVDFEKISLDQKGAKLSNGKSLNWSEVDWSISYVSQSFISLRSLAGSWNNTLLISPQYFLENESLVKQIESYRNEKQYNAERKIFFQRDTFQSMRLPFQILWGLAFFVIISVLIFDTSQDSFLKSLIDFAFVVVSVFFSFRNTNFNKEITDKLNPISISDTAIYLDDSHSIRWYEIDWQKSKVGFLRTRLVRKEAWKNKVTFWSMSYSKELREEILAKRAGSQTSNQAVVS